MTLLLGSGASIDRSSPVLRSSSKVPNRTRPEGRVCMGAVHRHRVRNCTIRLEIVEIELRAASKLLGTSPDESITSWLHSYFIAKSPLFHLHPFPLAINRRA